MYPEVGKYTAIITTPVWGLISILARKMCATFNESHSLLGENVIERRIESIRVQKILRAQKVLKSIKHDYL